MWIKFVGSAAAVLISSLAYAEGARVRNRSELRVAGVIAPNSYGNGYGQAAGGGLGAFMAPGGVFVLPTGIFLYRSSGKVYLNGSGYSAVAMGGDFKFGFELNPDNESSFSYFLNVSGSFGFQSTTVQLAPANVRSATSTFTYGGSLSAGFLIGSPKSSLIVRPFVEYAAKRGRAMFGHAQFPIDTLQIGVGFLF